MEGREPTWDMVWQLGAWQTNITMYLALCSIRYDLSCIHSFIDLIPRLQLILFHREKCTSNTLEGTDTYYCQQYVRYVYVYRVLLLRLLAAAVRHRTPATRGCCSYTRLLFVQTAVVLLIVNHFALRTKILQCTP